MAFDDFDILKPSNQSELFTVCAMIFSLIPIEVFRKDKHRQREVLDEKEIIVREKETELHLSSEIQ